MRPGSRRAACHSAIPMRPRFTSVRTTRDSPPSSCVASVNGNGAFSSRMDGLQMAPPDSGGIFANGPMGQEPGQNGIYILRQLSIRRHASADANGVLRHRHARCAHHLLESGVWSASGISAARDARGVGNTAAFRCVAVVWRTGPGAPRTIHGFAWRQEFARGTRTDSHESEVVLSCLFGGFTADYTITLTDKLRLELRTTNVSDRPAKANFGFHPYFLLARP